MITLCHRLQQFTFSGIFQPGAQGVEGSKGSNFWCRFKKKKKKKKKILALPNHHDTIYITKIICFLTKLFSKIKFINMKN